MFKIIVRFAFNESVREQVSDEIPFKIADLTVDEAYAHRFLEKVRDVHHFKTGKWKDVKITICI